MGAQQRLTGQALRERFQRFFEAKDHPWKASDSLVPTHDPTVLFTSAGMNQFKDYFLGVRTDLTRASSSQKCLRIGDLDNILGLQGHHTFFEMLGNFSFGDYFKREAIEWGWEFLTGSTDFAGKKKSPLGPNICLSLQPQDLWVSVYTDDDEAAKLWSQHIGVPDAKMRRLGATDNFWPANAPTDGPNGPCGPCSEIYFQRGDRSLEIWNLVFTQFDRQPDGSLTALPRQNIDTGMGLERLTQVVQCAEYDYETEIFAPTVRALESLVRAKRSEAKYLYAIADHVRAAVFCIGDGLLPGNGSKEYILRLLIRRAVRYGVKTLGIDAAACNGLMASLVPAVYEAMCGEGSPYRELRSQQAHIETVLRREEALFLATLDEGTARAHELLGPLAKQGMTTVPGDVLFKLYDTFGLPSDVTEDIAREIGFTGTDRAAFTKLLRQQQERSRAGSCFGGDVFTESYASVISQAGAATTFVGYTSLTAEGQVTAMCKDQQLVASATEGDAVDLVLHQTPFYGEQGGQVGDTGTMHAQGVELHVRDTQHAGHALVHAVTVAAGTVRVGDTLTAHVDAERRMHVMRNHTATHMLHAVLRETLGTHVQQRGSLVAPDRLRFDFTHPGSLDSDLLSQIEFAVNRWVMQDDPMVCEEMDLAAAKATGAIAFFGDTYGERVRVVSLGTYSKEFCGGTHLTRAGEVGPFKIIGEGSIASGVRRIEAVTGERATRMMREEAATLERLGAMLSRSPAQVYEAVQQLVQKQKQLEKSTQESQRHATLSRVDALAASRQEYKGVGVVSESLGDIGAGVLRQVADRLRHQLQNTVIVLAASNGIDKVSLILALTKDLVAAGHHAGQLIRPIAALVGGSGGGRQDLAQAGGKQPQALSDALSQAPGLITADMKG
jgi:alanyl-tRNA synthetase